MAHLRRKKYMLVEDNVSIPNIVDDLSIYLNINPTIKKAGKCGHIFLHAKICTSNA